jgi:N-acetylmuramoyl-L-alanine amidase
MKASDIKKIVVHCSATTEDTDYTFERLVKDHKARGFRKCGYHRYIRQNLTVHVGRAYNEQGAHAGKDNKDSIGLCYEGGVIAGGDVNNSKDHKDTRTPAMRALLLEEIIKAMQWVEANGGKIEQIVGHRDLSPDLDGDGIVEPHEWIKSCPCFDAVEEYKFLLK